MDIRGAGEALYIACEMEKRAIRLYERAMDVFADGSCQGAIRAILDDERNHLRQFEDMGAAMPDFERARLLSAQASRVLFSGGLMEAQRKGAFSSPSRLYAYAAAEEKQAAACYGDFAARLSGDAARAFAAVALEEGRHLARLHELLAQATSFEKETEQP